MPTFTSLGELGPPEWSIFHKCFGLRNSRKVDIFSNPDPFTKACSSLSQPDPSGGDSQLETAQKSNIKRSITGDAEIEDILDALQMLGKLPLSTANSIDQQETIG